LCARVFVLKLGRTVGTLTQAFFSESVIFSQMIGYQGTKPIAQKAEMPASEASHTYLEFKDVSCGNSLKKVSFGIRSGEALGIVDLDDPCGAVFFDLLSGKAQPGTGNIYIDGQPLCSSGKAKSAHIPVGFVMEPFFLFPNFTLEENIIFPIMSQKSKLAGILDSPELKYLASEYISSYIPCGGFEKKSYAVNNISSFIKRKMNICRALSRDPKCLIFINPTQYIDLTLKQEIYRDINSLKQFGKSILVISPSVDDLISVCDRVIILGEGRIKEILPFSRIETDNLIRAYGECLSDF
jgi:ABC-type sugar transport system ATPase subunit